MTDLVILAADRKMEQSVRAIVERSESTGTRAIVVDSLSHPQHDGGVRKTAHQYLRPYIRTHSHALVCLDHEGCGSADPPDELRGKIQGSLDVNGWRDRSSVVVLSPELEIWLWAQSPIVVSAVGWRSPTRLRTWLVERGYMHEGAPKPHRPKEALEGALRKVNKALSTAVYLEVAKNVGFAACTDPEFQRLLIVLRAWFPNE